ncbi:hypothetical protein MYX78_01015 [Acidobacteria bacterium AH-259-G07]|nr:hypothetical protein [Acidobacteria bacterium AH-259-G07]
MKHASQDQQGVLAVDPITRGFAFAIMEGSDVLVDSGIKHVRQDKHTRCLKRIAELLEHYQLDAVIVEDYTGKGSRRCLRVQRLIRAIDNLAAQRRIATYSFSREKVRNTFSRFGAVNRYEIATVIADHLPQLAPRLPPPRKLWMTEDDRMSIFDAVALALTFFHFKNKHKRAA